MTNKFQLSSTALLLGAIALTGCASKQTWSPELEDARQAYQQASSDPQVSALAAAELDSAQKQLKVAQDASDYFKSAEVISHEAALAKLKALEAQQTARALAAKQDLRLAQAEAVQPGAQPVLAAATPTPGGRAYGGHSAMESSLSETQQIAQQLAALSQQIMQLQARIEGGAMQAGSQTTGYTQQYNSTATQPMAAIIETEISPEIQTEPALAAAMSVPAEPELLSDARLHEELRAMNARPSSRGMSLTLGERYFEANSARVWHGRAARHLDNIAAVMSENPALMLDVEAHTDTSGSAEARNNLSSDRAIAIKSALVLRGVNAKRINATGYGDSAPIADNSTQLGQLQNRRVEIIFPNVAAM